MIRRNSVFQILVPALFALGAFLIVSACGSTPPIEESTLDRAESPAFILPDKSGEEKTSQTEDVEITPYLEDDADSFETPLELLDESQEDQLLPPEEFVEELAIDDSPSEEDEIETDADAETENEDELLEDLPPGEQTVDEDDFSELQDYLDQDLPEESPEAQGEIEEEVEAFPQPDLQVPEELEPETQVQPLPEPVPAIPEPAPQPAPELPVSEPEPAPIAPPARESPPPPPPFLRPAEPETEPPISAPTPGISLPELPSRTVPESPEEQIVFSRIARLIVGQFLELPFRGTGWVYLGELGNRQGLAYDSRRTDFERGSGAVLGMSFIFRAERAGTYILKFYRQDFIQDIIVNDYVQVIVGERNENSIGQAERVIGEPRWPPLPGTPFAEPGYRPGLNETLPGVRLEPQVETRSPYAEFPPETSQGEAVSPDRQNDGQRELSPAEYVRQARQEFDAGRVELAISIMDTFKQRYPEGMDEAWWLYGQLLEANSPGRDIRQALEYYRRLVQEFPQSYLVDGALRRIAYLERFYFNIR